jgi:ATP-binding cassette, subfamily C (CFTR/MRP), member 2
LSLLRILEAVDGQILIDGVDISTLSLKQLRESITMIMQDAVIFEGTLRLNIDPLKKHSDDKIIEVLKDCCLGNLMTDRD